MQQHHDPAGTPRRTRRGVLAAAAAAAVALPQLALAARVLAPMTEGPFYPPAPWRRGWSDWDADLTRVDGSAGPRVARGEHFGLQLTVADERGRVVDSAEVEIWQCDTLAHYRHPEVPRQPGRFDEGFQGYGEAATDRAGAATFRTIRPAPYAGRTPHIHVKLRHASFGEITSQLFVEGDPGNAGDFLWRRLSTAERAALAMKLQPAQAPQGAREGGLRWQTRHGLVVPA